MAEDRTDEILSAITTLSERLGSVEAAIATVDGKVTATDRKVNAIARKLLAPAEVIALGLPDARSGGSPGGGGSGEDSGGYARAAKSRE